MKWDQIAGKWNEFSGQVKQKWGKLTDDDISQISGKQTELSGRLQKHYGYTKEQAEEEINNFSKTLPPLQ